MNKQEHLLKGLMEISIRIGHSTRVAESVRDALESLLTVMPCKYAAVHPTSNTTGLAVDALLPASSRGKTKLPLPNNDDPESAFNSQPRIVLPYEDQDYRRHAMRIEHSLPNTTLDKTWNVDGLAENEHTLLVALSEAPASSSSLQIVSCPYAAASISARLLRVSSMFTVRSN